MSPKPPQPLPIHPDLWRFVDDQFNHSVIIKLPTSSPYKEFIVTTRQPTDDMLHQNTRGVLYLPPALRDASFALLSDLRWECHYFGLSRHDVDGLLAIIEPLLTHLSRHAAVYSSENKAAAATIPAREEEDEEEDVNIRDVIYKEWVAFSDPSIRQLHILAASLAPDHQYQDHELTRFITKQLLNPSLPLERLEHFHTALQSFNHEVATRCELATELMNKAKFLLSDTQSSASLLRHFCALLHLREDEPQSYIYAKIDHLTRSRSITELKHLVAMAQKTN